ncbi:MAG: cobalamin-independent methionine synthase II family protein [Dehalococcoidia bacterium]
MKLSTERILTTHVGSLPRSQEVVDMLFAKELEQPYDQDAFDATMRAAVKDVVAKQVAAGVDVVSDGETSKIGYSTYIKDRLTGFEGDSPRRPAADLVPYPELREKMGRILGSQQFKRPKCVGPIAVKDREQLRKDIANLKDAVEGSGATEAFMNAASPGVISGFQPNEYYPTHGEYIEALAEAMSEEYEAIVNAGLLLQVDCPDLAMVRHIAFQDLSEEDFLKRAEHHVEALNHALRNVPADRVRMHVCWGNYEGPHDHDIALERILDIVLKAKPSAISLEAANPRHAHEWAVFKERKLPDGKVLMPGFLDTTSNFVEHPELVAQRVCQYAEVVGREQVIASSDCGFGTFAGYGKLDSAIAYVKLRSLADGAAIASQRLWG